MKRRSLNQSGFGIVEVVIIVLVLAMLGGGTYLFMQNRNQVKPTDNSSQTTEPAKDELTDQDNALDDTGNDIDNSLDDSSLDSDLNATL